MKKLLSVLLCFMLLCEAGCFTAAASQTVTAEEWKLVKDKWREYLVGNETNNFSDTYVQQVIKGINDQCESAWGLMNKNTQILALFGTTPCQETTDMTKQFNYLEDMAMAYGTFGSIYYHNEDLKSDILFAFDWLYKNIAELLK